MADFKGAFIALGVIATVFGIALSVTAAWLWPYVKAFIHAVTA